MRHGAGGFRRAWKQCAAWLLAVVAAAASFDVIVAAQNSPAALVGNAESGKRLYEKNTCFFCHGTAGQGGVDGARLALVARNLQGFTRYVRQPTGRMPAFTDKILSDQELADIFAYLRSLPQAKAVKDIPLLDQLRK